MDNKSSSIKENKMRKVILFEDKNKKELVVENFKALLDQYDYIGFEVSRHRFMVYKRSPMIGVAINADGCWNSLKGSFSPDEGGEYFVFETPRQLLKWMAGDDDE